jgi:hypothetical protein
MPSTGGAGTKLGAMADQGYVILSADASTAVYEDNNLVLQKTPTTGATPTALAMMVAGIPGLGATDDLASILYFKQQDSMTGFFDLYLVNGTSMPVTLATMPNATIFGNAYTTDQKYATYYDKTKTVMMTALVGQFEAIPVTGGTPKAIGDGSGWNQYAAGGSKSVFADGWVTHPGSTDGIANLSSVDVSTGTTNLIATSIEADFYVSHDGTKVMYSYTGNPNMQGIYVAPVP